MQNTIAERITLFRLSEKYTESLFTSKIGVPQSTFSKQISNNNASLQTILGILTNFPTLSAEWLLLGVGTMNHEDDAKTPADTELQEVCIEQAKEIFRLKKRIAELETLSKK